MNIIRSAIVIVLITGCVTAGKASFEKSVVLERMDGYEETPEFASGRYTMINEGKNAIFINIITMDGDSRPEACLKASSMSSQAEILKYIKSAITTSSQLNEMDASSDPSYEALTAFLSQGKLSGVKVMEQYWERREESSSSGERIFKLKCAAKLAISKSMLDKQLKEALNGTSQGNPEIRKALENAQKNFIDGLSTEKMVGH